MPARTRTEDDGPSLEQTLSHINHIFNEAQDSVDNHQKNWTHLHRVHKEAGTFVQTVRRRGAPVDKPIGELMFSEAFIDLVLRGLIHKKGVKPADNIAKFVGGYLKYANEKAQEERTQEDDEEGGDTRASRFTARLLRKLLGGFEAKDKNVRYRVSQMVTEMVAHLGELDIDDYTNLRKALRQRVYDKDAHVRVQAIISLARLVELEEPDEVPEGEKTGLEMIVQALSEDPAPEVRRAAMLNIPIDPKTLPYILDRTRDIDLTTRKMVFANVLAPNINIRTEDGGAALGPTHPRAMKIEERELIVLNGLGDREPTVRNVAAKLLSNWLDAVTPEPIQPMKTDETNEPDLVKLEDSDGAATKAQELAKSRLREGVLNVVGLFDLGEGTVAEDALISIFKTRPEVLSDLDFSHDEYWDSATSESVFLTRVFVEFCKKEKDLARLENTLPVVTALAYRLQSAYNALHNNPSEDADAAVVVDLTDEQEDERLEKELLVVEMLKLMVQLDYADEIGRRKMFNLVREMMGRRDIPPSLLSPCLDLLRELSNGEGELIRLVTEIINDLRYEPDRGDEDDPPVPSSDDVGATPATVKPPRTALLDNPKDRAAKTKEEADNIDYMCLLLCTGMLERVNGTLENHSTLDGVLTDLIMPSVRRTDLKFREMGLTALGLCCLISPRLTNASFELFSKQFLGNNPISLKIRLISLIFDIVMINGQEILGPSDKRESLLDMFFKGLSQDQFGKSSTSNSDAEKESKKLQAVICEGLAKLVLAGMLTEKEVLLQLLLSYLSPDTADNQELRQCLSYFSQMYSYTSPENQQNIRKIFLDIFEKLSDHRQNTSDDDEMVSAAQIAGVLIELTNPDQAREVPGKVVDEEVHIDLAIDIMWKVFIRPEVKVTKEEQKALCQCLQKLYLPDEADLAKLRLTRVAIYALTTHRPFGDATSKNAINKFEKTFCKKYEKELEDFTEEEYRQHETLQDIFADMDDMIPLGDEEEIDLDIKPKGRKRRSTSIISASTDAEVLSGATSRSARSKSGAKKPRLSRSDAESADEDVRQRRARPKRAVASKPKAPPEFIVISSDSEVESTPVPRRTRASPPPNSVAIKEEIEDINDAVDDLFGGSAPGHDSIMDGDSEEEEEEVNDLVFGEEED